MKLIFFLVAFCLLSIRVYFSWSGKDRERRGESTADMVIKSDNFYQEIKYSGKFRLKDDETGFKSISPGGYFKFRRNDEWVKAESNLQGEIEYRIYDGKNQLTLNDESGRRLMLEAVKEMIAWGFDADARMERIYRKGGSQALLNQVDSMRTDQVKMLYIERLLAVDSLSSGDLSDIAKKIGSLGSDMDKDRLLNRLSTSQLKDSATNQAYFNVIAGMGSNLEKANALRHVLDQDSFQKKNADKILDIAGTLGSDLDKANLFRELIGKGYITGARFDSLLDRIDRLGSDLDKISLYKDLIEIKGLTDPQWINLMNKTAKLGSDMDKAYLLQEIAKKMPRTENLKAAYLTAAKTISNDPDYGKAVRAVE
ncbi:MAG: hypothetical protein Q8926_14460 [Bacteroidota bacterium]|nr:hypothetical protein [Bacteroidota bacterium]